MTDASSDDTVGLIGLGLMGTAMSTRLIAAGYTVVGTDPVEAARRAHTERGGVAVDDIAQVVGRCRLTLLSLPNGDVTRQVCLGEGGIAASAAPGTVVVETSTILAEEVEEMAAGLGERGIHYYDAALSGSSDMVGRGEALGMVGGDGEGIEDVHRVLDAICRNVRAVGRVGDGMRAKIVVNAVLTLNRFALAEGLVLAEQMGVDSAQMLDVLRDSAATSRAMDMWGPRMVARKYDEPRSRIKQHNKDAVLTLATGRKYGAPMLLSTQVNSVVQMALNHGMHELDNACIVEMLRWMAGSDEPLPKADA